MPNWDAVTKGWVERGLIDASKRAALRADLEALPPETPGLPLGPVITLLVAAACWLLTGAFLAALVLSSNAPPEPLLIAALLGAAGASVLLLGGLMRPAPSLLPIARGLLTASPPLLTFGLLAIVDEIPPREGMDWRMLLLLPAILSLPIAFTEGSRSWSATSALTLAFAAIPMTTDRPHALTAWVGIAATLAALALLSVLTRWLPDRAACFQAAVPSALLYLTIATFASPELFDATWQTLGLGNRWEVEKALQLLLEATLVTGFGLIARSAFTLVPAILLVAAATITVASEVGSWMGGTLALGAIGGLFLAAASALWVTRTRSIDPL